MEPELLVAGVLILILLLGASVQLLRESRRPFVMVGLLVAGSAMLMVAMTRMLEGRSPARTAAVPAGERVMDFYGVGGRRAEE
jgi:uncharacterized membrane protein